MRIWLYISVTFLSSAALPVANAQITITPPGSGAIVGAFSPGVASVPFDFSNLDALGDRLYKIDPYARALGKIRPIMPKAARIQLYQSNLKVLSSISKITNSANDNKKPARQIDLEIKAFSLTLKQMTLLQQIALLRSRLESLAIERKELVNNLGRSIPGSRTYIGYRTRLNKVIAKEDELGFQLLAAERKLAQFKQAELNRALAAMKQIIKIRF